MEDCEKSYDLICDLLKSGANFGRGKQKDIMVNQKKINELIKQGALHKEDGKQFYEDPSQEEEKEDEEE